MADATITLTVDSPSAGQVTREVTIDDTNLLRIIDNLANVYPDSNGNPGTRSQTINRWFRSWLRASRDSAKKYEQDDAAVIAKNAVTDIDIGNI